MIKTSNETNMETVPADEMSLCNVGYRSYKTDVYLEFLDSCCPFAWL